MKSEYHVFNGSNTGGRAVLEPAVSFSKNGLISFNRLACDKMKLKAGEMISIRYDKNKPKEWWVKVDPEGIILRQMKYGFLSCNCSMVVKTMMVNLNVKKGFRVRIGSEPEEGWYSLITSAINT